MEIKSSSLQLLYQYDVHAQQELCKGTGDKIPQPYSDTNVTLRVFNTRCVNETQK